MTLTEITNRVKDAETLLRLALSPSEADQKVFREVAEILADDLRDLRLTLAHYESVGR